MRPAQTLPPIGTASSLALSADVEPSRSLAGKKVTTVTASSSSTADTSSRFTLPMCRASTVVAADPVTDPSVPPTAMKPNNRFACSLRKKSAMKPQNTDTTNRSKTLVQMKKARPIQTSPREPSAGANTRIST